MGVGDMLGVSVGDNGRCCCCCGVGLTPRTSTSRDVTGALRSASTACLCVQPTSVTSLICSRRSPTRNTSVDSVHKTLTLNTIIFLFLYLKNKAPHTDVVRYGDATVLTDVYAFVQLSSTMLSQRLDVDATILHRRVDAALTAHHSHDRYMTSSLRTMRKNHKNFTLLLKQSHTTTCARDLLQCSVRSCC